MAGPLRPTFLCPLPSIPIAHNSRPPAAGELSLRPDQARRREGHVTGARGPGTDPARPGLARSDYDQLGGVPFARTIAVPLRQGAEYD